jgi:methyl-accepting chemotaxis protein
MFKSSSLRTRLLTAGVVLTLVPLVIITAVVAQREMQLEKLTAQECAILAQTDLDHMAAGVYSLCETQHQVLQGNVDAGLNVSKDVMGQYGVVSFDSETVTWNAVNQYTKQSQSVSLPRMKVGDSWLGNNKSASSVSPVVDHVQKLVGGTATIFQRMNDSGDMLRVCTNVMKTDGNRAIGTYIPAVNPDGKPNPVVQAVLSGKTYRGRAFVVDRWYLTAYEPIRNGQGEIVGINYFGVPMDSAVALRQAIMDIQVGQTGYVYVLDSKGNYVISKDGKRDGENIYEAKDANGVLFIQEICQKATALKSREVAEQFYPWKNKGESEARMKVARLMYYEPWDWVIGVGSYVDEFKAAEIKVAEISNQNLIAMLIVCLGALLVTSGVWFFISKRTSNEFTSVTKILQDNSDQVANAANQVAESSQLMASGASESAASIEEISASLEELSVMTKQNAQNSKDSDSATGKAWSAASSGVAAMKEMTDAIGQIKHSSDETARILKSIDEIAFQTNLLALNAAVEAARAGDAGKGFAVVAEEVRNLAGRSAEAAKNTATLIDESQTNANSGVLAADQVSKLLAEIETNVGVVKELASQVAQASNDQAEGIGEISKGLGQLEVVTQSNAANAEESAAASSELSSQAEGVRNVVTTLEGIVNGKGKGQDVSSYQAPDGGFWPEEASKNQVGTQPRQESVEEYEPEKVDEVISL